jgi:hypothetical protein
LLKVLASTKTPSVEKTVSDGELPNGKSRVCLLNIVIITIAEEAGSCAKARVKQLIAESSKIVGIEVQPFTNLSNFMVELADFPAASAVLSFLITDRKLLPLNENLLQLLILHNYLVDFREAFEAQLHSWNL